MRSKIIENGIKDCVIRAVNACWIETVQKEVIDLSKYPRVGIMADEQRGEILFAVVAYPIIHDDDRFEILWEGEDEGEAREYYSGIVYQLQKGQTVH